MFVECPHCSQMIEIIELNCRIFRCGIFKSNYKQIDPHLSKSDCMRLVADNCIFGCGKPFRILDTKSNQQAINQQAINQPSINQPAINNPVDLSNNPVAVKCDYI